MITVTDLVSCKVALGVGGKGVWSSDYILFLRPATGVVFSGRLVTTQPVQSNQFILRMCKEHAYL